MSTNQQQPTPQRLDTALLCLVAAAQIYGIPADAQQLRRAYVMNAVGMDSLTLLRAAKDVGLKVKMVTTEPEEFSEFPLPAIIMLTNNNYLLAMRADKDKILVYDPYKQAPFHVPLENLKKAWSGQIILLTKRITLKEIGKKFNISWFIPVVLQYKNALLKVLGISLVLQVFGLLSPMFTQVIIDKVLVHRSLGTLDILVIGMVTVMLFQAWFTGLRSYIFTHTTNKIDVTLSTKLFRHITALPIKYFETWQVGDVVSRVREMDNIRQFITGSALTVVLDTVFAIVYIIAMFTYSVKLSVVSILALPFYIVLNLVIAPMFRERLNRRFMAGTENQTFLIETVTGIQTVKSLAMENNCIQKWEQLLARYAKTAFTTANLANIAGSLGSLIQQLFNAAILWLGAHSVMEGTISIGELIAFQMLAGQVAGPILRLINMWQYFQQTQVSIDRLGDILNEQDEPAFNPSRTTLPAITGEVVLDRVSFRYRPDMSDVLQQVSLTIPAGTKVGIVGRSGSGKSTLTKLIQRLYVPDSGRVLIDGVDLAQVEPAWLRRQIGVVLQENYLFSGSIADNIAIARPDVAAAEVERVGQIAGVTEFAAELPDGYKTQVGERGTALSGGQRQRVAIARALLTNPQVLIFDEATSALDYESERIIMDNLDAMAAGRTLIMIAHRLTTVRHCDIIFVMERGRIIEQGNHEALLKNKGFYWELNQQQEK